ncbi:MAG: transcriptional regulator, XRE family with cupin sensor [Rhodobacteraceae bacterium HLUCCA12]|nr:MAG: transcriptional regulator, XRE family with cupin sensor [Rhodobacteraceae bacterium HLUCCA12]
MDGFDVGTRLRVMRMAAGLSQRGLADMSGVPHGQISMIETNRSSPSVASLRKILGGLGVTLAEFFEPDRPATEAVFFGPDDLRDLTSLLPGAAPGRSGRIRLMQVGNARAHNLQILHERYEPGADTGKTMLDHPGSEGGVVIAGEIELTVGAQTRLLRAGDAYLFNSTVPHRFRNIGTANAVVVSACTPPYL